MRSRTSVKIVCVLAIAASIATACTSNGGKKAKKASDLSTVSVKGITLPEPELKSVTIGESAIDIGSMPIYNIKAEGLDKLFGMNVSIKTFNGDAPAVQALVAGQIDVDDSSGGMFTTQTAGKKAKSVFIIETAVSDVLFTQGNIRTAADLKGKSIAVSSLGSYSYAEALLSIKAIGLKPGDVTLAPIGHDSDRLAALKSGAVAGAILDTTLTKTLTAAGYTALVDLQKVDNPGYTGLALIVPDAFAAKYPNTTLALVAMYQMGLTDFLHNDRAKSAATWAKYSQEPAAQAAEEVATQLAVAWKPVDGHCEQATLDFQKSILVATNPALKSVDPTSVCTDEYVNKLKALGLQKATGVDGY